MQRCCTGIAAVCAKGRRSLRTAAHAKESFLRKGRPACRAMRAAPGAADLLARHGP